MVTGASRVVGVLALLTLGWGVVSCSDSTEPTPDILWRCENTVDDDSCTCSWAEPTAKLAQEVQRCEVTEARPACCFTDLTASHCRCGGFSGDGCPGGLVSTPTCAIRLVIPERVSK